LLSENVWRHGTSQKLTIQ